VDEVLAAAGQARRIAVTTAGFATALALAGATELIATVPERHTAGLRAGLFCFALPFAAPEILVSMLWHPRNEGDAGHRWLRGCVRAACAAVTG